jgi:uncharacterized protein (TIGR02246 family)
VPTLSCEETTYQRSSRLFKRMLFLLALSFVVTGARAQSGPDEVVSALMSSWNAKDAHAFASQFTEDATFVNVTGTIWIGPKDIEERLANAAAFKSSHAEIKPESLRFLRPDVALLHASWTITGDPRSPQPRSYLMTMVVSKRNGRWFIFAAQNGSAFDHSALSGTKYISGSSLPTTVRENAEVRRLITELDNDWNRSDSASLANLFAENSDLVDTSAHRVRGRADIEEHMADLFAHSLKGTNSRTTVLTINFLGLDLAVLEVRWELSGGAQGDTPMQFTGLRLLSHRDGNWRIVAAQDTIARPLPQHNP